MIKKVYCFALSASLISGVSCSVQTKTNRDPAPMPPAGAEIIESSQTQLSLASSSPDKFKFQTAKLDGVISSLVSSGNLSIKDSRGKDVTFQDYKLNPTQYFLLMKIRPSADQYRALKTSVVSDLSDRDSLAKNRAIALTFEVFEMTGPTANFTSEQLPEPVINEKFSINTAGNTISNFNNIAEMKGLLDRVKEKLKLASAPSTFDRFENFLFPTAFAASHEEQLLTTAIVFSGVSLTTYLFGFPKQVA